MSVMSSSELTEWEAELAERFDKSDCDVKSSNQTGVKIWDTAVTAIPTDVCIF